jgi:hypothetical protein
MPETRSGALGRAARLGFPRSSVVKSSGGGYFIAPRGVTATGAKHAYAECRNGGGSKRMCAGVAHKVQGGRRR